MKKLLIAILSVICLLCFAVGCLPEDDNSSTLPDSSIPIIVTTQLPIIMMVRTRLNGTVQINKNGAKPLCL